MKATPTASRLSWMDDQAITGLDTRSRGETAGGAALLYHVLSLVPPMMRKSAKTRQLTFCRQRNTVSTKTIAQT